MGSASSVGTGAPFTELDRLNLQQCTREAGSRWSAELGAEFDKYKAKDGTVSKEQFNEAAARIYKMPAVEESKPKIAPAAAVPGGKKSVAPSSAGAKSASKLPIAKKNVSAGVKKEGGIKKVVPATDKSKTVKVVAKHPARPIPAGKDSKTATPVAVSAVAIPARKIKVALSPENKAAVDIQRICRGRRARKQVKFLRAIKAEEIRIAKLANGDVTIKYNMYDEKFRIENHSTTAAAIDDAYALTFVMPKCKVHLSTVEKVSDERFSYIVENPEGVYRGLLAGETYYVHVQQDGEQLAKDQRETKAKLALLGKGESAEVRTQESCSCIEGNPCVDKYCCKDWEHRYSVAHAHGWKGMPLYLYM